MNEDLAITKLSAARFALSECKTAMQAKHVSDIAEAARVYLQRANAGIEAVNEATEIRILAERQMGTFLAEMEKAKGTKGQLKGRDVSGGTIEAPLETDAPTLAEIGISKKQSAQAQKLASMPEEQFANALTEAKAKAGRLTVKAVIQHATINAQPTEKAQRQIVLDFAALAGQKFGCIYVDPPWKYSNQGTRGATNNHYSTMTVADIAALPVESVSADKAHLHLWVTNAFLQDAFSIITAWGFEFKSTFVWVKSQMGMGNYWRNSHEIMLTATRGKQTAISKAEMSWLECKRGAHSCKPDAIRERIERLSPPPYLEMFGRKSVDGWTVFGNEVSDELV